MATQSRPAAEAVVGFWRLVSFEARIDGGEVAFPFGADAHGRLTYTADRHFAVQVMRRARPAIASGDQMTGTPEEALANFRSCVSYFGTYDVDPEGGFVVHHVEGSLLPNWMGGDQKRFLRLDGDRLELSTPPVAWGGGQAVAALVWERVAA